MFYHRDLAATSGSEYDDLFEKYWSDELPWESEFLDDPLRLIHREPLDHDHVSLRFPICDYARRIGEYRAQAKRDHGEKSGEQYAWKLQANTMFGILASRHHPTCNVVAGNVITAQGRAEAYALMMALNGIQVITDGATYRRDRIPACAFAECVELMPDYPLRHADEHSGIPFHDPESVPEDDEEFTKWYQEHVKRFFRVDGDEYERLFASHGLEHKETKGTDRPSFDAMTCDGSANYTKFLREDGEWTDHDCAMRAYRRDSKAELVPWILEAYRYDEMESLPPITRDEVLLKLEPAKQKANRAIRDGQISEVYLPLSLKVESVRVFKVLKPSAIIFRTPRQRKLVIRQLDKLQQATGCGLDLLVLRRPYGTHDRSITAVAEEIYHYIQSGGRDLTKKFNLSAERLSKEEGQAKLVAKRQGKLRELKEQADRELFERIDVALLDEDELLTGIV